MQDVLLGFTLLLSDTLAKAQQTAAVAGAVTETVKTPAAIPSLSQLVISLALVVGLVVVLAFLYKKMQLKCQGPNILKWLEPSILAREKSC